MNSAIAVTLPNVLTKRAVRRRSLFLILGLVLLSIAIAAMGIGAVQISPAQVCAILSQNVGLPMNVEFEARQEAVLMAIRLPRVLIGVLTGAALAVAGASLQGLFRNPLADPGLIGISGGAALGAVTTIVLGDTLLKGITGFLGVYALPVAAFTVGLAVTWTIYRLSTKHGRSDVATMLLAGIAVNAFIGAIIGYLVYISSDAQLRTLTFWTMGSLGGATWKSVSAIFPFTLLAIIMLMRQARVLNAILLGEQPAAHLGFNVEASKRKIILLSALAVGSTVAITGAVGFIGLVVPHLIRSFLGADHRGVIPAAAMLGAALLLGADLVARTVVAPAELPTGIVTAIFGAPFFLWLLLKGKQRNA